MMLGRGPSRRRSAKYIVSPRAARRMVTPMAIMTHGPHGELPGGGAAASRASRAGAARGSRVGSRAEMTRGEINPGTVRAEFACAAGGLVIGVLTAINVAVWVESVTTA